MIAHSPTWKCPTCGALMRRDGAGWRCERAACSYWIPQATRVLLPFALLALAGCAGFRATLGGVSNGIATTTDRAGALVLREACAREMAAIGRVGTWDGEHCTESGQRAGTPADDVERAELARVRDVWRRVRDAHEAVVQAQRALAASLRVSDDAAAYRLVAVVGDLSRAYESLRAAASAVGLDLPALPRLP